MVIRLGRNGRFLACSLYPEHKETRPLPGRRAAAPGGDRRGLPEVRRGHARQQDAAGSARSSAARATPTASTSRRTARRRPIRSRSRSICPKNKDGHLVPRRARRTGNVFWGCSNYPRCDFTTNHEPLGGLHDTDDGPLARKDEDGALPDLRLDERHAGRTTSCPGERYAGGPPNPEALARPARARGGPRAGGASEDRRSPTRRRAVRRPHRRPDGHARSSRPPTRERGAGRRRDRPRPRAVPPLPRRARRLAAHPARLRHGRRRLPRLAGRRGARTGDARRAPTCAPTSASSARAARARRSRSASPPSARSTAGPRANDLAPGDPWGAIATPRLPRRLPRVLEVEQVDALLAVVDADLEAVAGRRPRARGAPASRSRCATGRSSRPPTPPACASASWPRPTLGVARPAARRDPGPRQGPQGADRAARAAGPRGPRRLPRGRPAGPARAPPRRPRRRPPRSS